MRFIILWCGLLASALGKLVLFRISRGRQMFLFIPKLTAGALIAVGGGLGLFAFLAERRNWLVRLWGLGGAAIAGWHIYQVAMRPDPFAESFGDSWRARIQPEQRRRLLPVRWQPILPETAEPVWQRDVTCGTSATGKPLLCDIWEPPPDVPRSGLGIIYLHGSGWLYMDKDMGTRPLFRHLAAQGHVVVDLAYTLAPAGDLYSMLREVKSTVLWLKDGRYGVNPARVVLMGGSAGGHLAQMAAYTANVPEFQPEGGGDTAVRGVVTMYGVTDVEFFHRQALMRFSDMQMAERSAAATAEPMMSAAFGADAGRVGLNSDHIYMMHEMAPALLRATPEENPALYALASPVTHVGPHCPPTMLIHGLHDFAVNPAQSRRLHRKLREAGVQSVLVELPHTDHGFDLVLPRINPAFQSMLYDLERFLALLA